MSEWVRQELSSLLLFIHLINSLDSINSIPFEMPSTIRFILIGPWHIPDETCNISFNVVLFLSFIDKLIQVDYIVMFVLLADLLSCNQ